MLFAPKNRFFALYWLGKPHCIAFKSIACRALAFACWLVSWVPSGVAQVIPDTTSVKSVVTNARCLGVCRITGGSLTTDGRQLFHSFREFSVPTGGQAFFDQAPGVEMIFARVTGNSLSKILGQIRANGDADLFLLNPNGIQFGANAFLDLGGSFFATTASSLVFADGQEFSTIAPGPAPLLTITLVQGLQFGNTPGAIQVNGANLSVHADQALGLIGGNLTLTGATLSTGISPPFSQPGRIELGAVGGSGPVNFNLNNPAFDYGNVTAFGDIRLSQGTTIQTNGFRGGTIQLQGRQIDVRGGSRLVAKPSTLGGATIQLYGSEQIQLAGAGTAVQISLGAETIENGNSLLQVKTERLALSSGAQIGLQMAGTGRAGRVNIEAGTIGADGVGADGTGTNGVGGDDFTGIVSFNGGVGSGASMTIEANHLQLTQGAQILSHTAGVGRGGALTLRVPEIEVLGVGENGVSGIRSVSGAFGGAGGDLTIETARLLVADGGQILTETQGLTEAGGNLSVTATDWVELRGQGTFGLSGLFVNTLSPQNPLTGQIVAGQAPGGNLSLTTNQLRLLDQATIDVSHNPANPKFNANFNPNLVTVDSGFGPAGNLAITAETLTLANQASIGTATLSGGNGNIVINVAQVELSNGSQITAQNHGHTGAGGDIWIEAGTVLLERSSLIATNAGVGAGGNLEIIAVDDTTLELDQSQITARGGGGNISLGSPIVLLRNNSLVRATGLSTSGGNVLILADTLLGLDNSDIIAEAESGLGGRIVVTGFNSNVDLRDVTARLIPFTGGDPTTNIFGFGLRQQRTSSNDILITSLLGGAFNSDDILNDPDAKLRRHLDEVPDRPLNLGSFLAPACNVASDNQFVILGQGGLPHAPNQLLASQTPWEDLRGRAQRSSEANLSPESQSPSTSRFLPASSSRHRSVVSQSVTSQPIVEARGWVYGADGQLRLVHHLPPLETGIDPGRDSGRYPGTYAQALCAEAYPFDLAS